MARDPSVPLAAFNQMNNGLLRLIEQESRARREHEERITQIIAAGLERIGVTIAEHLQPTTLPEPSAVPLRMSEEEEDLRHARGTHMIDQDRFAAAMQELEFRTSPGVIDHFEFS